jgi:adenylate cyclase
VPILVSDYTRKHAPQAVWREIDKVRVKGKEKAVTIYEPIALDKVSAESKKELRIWAEVLRAYRAQAWDAAELALVTAQRSEHKPLYDVFLKRIRQLREQPPAADWDGAYSFDSK